MGVHNGLPGQPQRHPPAYPAYPAHAPGYPPPPPGRRGKRTLAMAGITLVVLALIATGTVLFLNGTDDSPDEVDAATPGDTAPSQQGRPLDPRAPVSEMMTPVVQDDWQVVLSPRGTMAFDVPPQWHLNKEGSSTFWPADDPEEHGSDHAYSLRDTAEYAAPSCPGQTAAWAGTRYVQGATDTAEAVRSVSSNLAWAVYDQGLRGDLTTTEALPFENEHGISGHVSYSTSIGAPEYGEGACASAEGRAIAISFINSSSDIVAWGLVADTGHEHAVPEEIIDLIVSSIRPYHAR